MIYMLLADGFEETEALCPLDILRRADLDVCTVGIGGKQITGAHGITVTADLTEDGLYALQTINLELLILPGGMPGTKNLDASPLTHKLLDIALKQDSYIAAICAAPMILGKRGILRNKLAVCYPSFEQYLEGAIIPSNKKAVRDGKIITAMGMGVATDFGLLTVEALCGKSKADYIRSAILAD